MKKIKKLLLSIISIGLLSLLVSNMDKITYAFSNKDNNPKIINNNKDKLIVHYIDVGQGDSIFIELPNKETMLIDAGEKTYGEVVYNYINNLNYNYITYLIGTHPHSDHIGGLQYIIENIEVKHIYMPKVVHTTKTYENLLTTISNHNLKINKGIAGTNIINQDNLIIDIIAPNKDEYDDLNNYSIVLKITYGNNKFLFMGDAETLSEKEITSDVSSDVIKIGHHGSNTSSSLSFIKKVNAKYGIIMVGNDNKYNLPKDDILKRYKDIGTLVYRTDINGNIIIISDGNNIEVKKDK